MDLKFYFKIVIDFGLTKSMFCDDLTHFSSLRLIWASQSNLKQRMGRAGKKFELLN